MDARGRSILSPREMNGDAGTSICICTRVSSTRSMKNPRPKRGVMEQLGICRRTRKGSIRVWQNIITECSPRSRPISDAIYRIWVESAGENPQPCIEPQHTHPPDGPAGIHQQPQEWQGPCGGPPGLYGGGSGACPADPTGRSRLWGHRGTVGLFPG